MQSKIPPDDPCDDAHSYVVFLQIGDSRKRVELIVFMRWSLSRVHKDAFSWPRKLPSLCSGFGI